MEALTRLVTDSLARHGFDRPVDPRRLQWSRWFRCDSTHSLLVVPSRPGIFALAEEIMNLEKSAGREGHDLSRALTSVRNSPALPTEGIADGAQTSDVVRRMLAVLQFSEDDDMAFTLDRMFTCDNPMRARLASGRCFLRFVVIADLAQRRGICSALNQWLLSSSEKASGLPADFQSSLELSPVTASVTRAPSPASVDSVGTLSQPLPPKTLPRTEASAPHLDSGANKNLHCPHPLPSGF
ncbi:MAG: hypothetical protein WAM69_14335 [Candidatus Sulfotelmatobacter sp.]